MNMALTRIRRIARPMSLLVTLALVVLPLVLFVALLSGGFSEADLRGQFTSITLPDTISPVAWAVTYGVGAISVVLVLLALWHMRILFSLYAMGDVLGLPAARAIRRIGLSLLALAVAGVVGNTLIILALTSGNPAGERALAIGFSNDDIFLFFASGLLIVIGWAMAEAARIADENRGFI